MVCEICNKDKEYFTTYLTKGLDQYKQHEICKDCVKKFNKNLNIKWKARMFEWRADEDNISEVSCMHCQKKVLENQLHSFLFNDGKGGHSDKWYNFCSDCAVKNFSSIITWFNIR